MTTWFIAALRYPSGRLIFVGAHPEKAEFTATRETAGQWPSEQHAEDAANALKRAFQLENPEVLKIVIEPIPAKSSA